MLRSEDGGDLDTWRRECDVDEMPKIAIDRRGITDETNPAAAQPAGVEEPGRTRNDGHCVIIAGPDNGGWTLAIKWRAMIVTSRPVLSLIRMLAAAPDLALGAAFLTRWIARELVAAAGYFFSQAYLDLRPPRV